MSMTFQSQLFNFCSNRNRNTNTDTDENTDTNCENTLKSLKASDNSCLTFVAEVYGFGQCYTLLHNVTQSYTLPKIFLPRPTGHMAPVLSANLEKQSIFEEQQGYNCWENLWLAPLSPSTSSCYNFQFKYSSNRLMNWRRATFSALCIMLSRNRKCAKLWW